jgi:hypothetical protein
MFWKLGVDQFASVAESRPGDPKLSRQPLIYLSSWVYRIAVSHMEGGQIIDVDIGLKGKSKA